MRVSLFTILLISIQFVCNPILGQSKSIIPAYYHLKGTIDGKSAITMDLVLSHWGNAGYLYTGYYCYDIYKKPIEIEKFLCKYTNDTISIHTQGNERFKGKFDGHTFSGIWCLEDAFYTEESFVKKRLKQLPFKLEIDTSQSVNFLLDNYCDSMVMFKKMAYPPKAFYSYGLLFSTNKNAGVLNGLLAYFYGKNSRENITGKLKAEGESMLDRFNAPANHSAKDGTLNTLGEWNNNSNTDVIYNDRNLFSIEFIQTSNEGGNHGYRHSRYCSYSVQDQRCVRIEDIINPQDTMILKTLMVKQMDKAGWPGFKASSIILPSDFYVTPTGLSLIYEVPTAMYGFQLPVFIPFSELGDKLKKQSWMQ